jgi:hypothetical protein
MAKTDVKLRRCPRCRSYDIGWIEFVNAFTTFYQSKDGIEPIGHNGVGMVQRVEGSCLRCKHQWKARGVGQIGDLLGRGY